MNKQLGGEEMSFRENLKRIRKDKKINQRELAGLSELSFSMISKLESGEQSNPSLETIDKVAKGLGVDSSELVSSLAIETKQYEQFEKLFNSDIGNMLDFLITQLDSENYLLKFEGADLDDELREVLKNSLSNIYETAKLLNKK